MAHRVGWKETKIKISEALDRRLRAVAVARGWSMDTCARKAMKRAARRGKVKLPGGNEVEILRRSKETLLAGKAARIWVTFPGKWGPGLDKLVAASDVHSQISPLWRAALLDWLDIEERKIEKAQGESGATAA